MSIWLWLQAQAAFGTAKLAARTGAGAIFAFVHWVRDVAGAGKPSLVERPLRALTRGERFARRWAVAALMASVVIASTGLALKPAKAGPITVAFSPLVSFEDIVDRVYRAGGLVIARADLDGVVVAIGPQDEVFHEMLRAEGAYLIMNGQAGILLSSAE